MDYINKLTGYVMMAGILLILLAGVCIAMVIMVRRNGSKKLKDDVKDYRQYSLADSSEFIPIEDIKNDMIIEMGGRRFIAVIKCRGSDFYKSNLAEKVRIKNNYTAFIQALTGPITYRQHGEEIDMGHTRKRYLAAYNHCLSDTYQLTEDYKEYKHIFDQIRGTGDPQEEELADLILKIQKKLEAHNWRLLHLESQIQYIEQVSGPGANQQKLSQIYVVDWESDAGILSEAMPFEELCKKAQVELEKKCRGMIHQLTSAGVSASRCQTAELIDICRRHFKPLTGNRYTVQEIVDSSFGVDIITVGPDRLEEELDAELADRFLS